jgi:hypothetical protein
MNVVDRVVAALCAHDIDAFVACYAADARIEEGNDGRILAHGHDALRARYGKMFADNPKAHWHVLHRIDAGEFVIQHEQVVGLAAVPTLHVCVYRITDGLVHEERVLR